MIYKTSQENFWHGEFGNEYVNRHLDEMTETSKIILFSQILRSAPRINSIVELGCNIGLNLKALSKINENFDMCGYEINNFAVHHARKLNVARIIEGTIIEKIPADKQYDISFTRGVLIHINPEELDNVYDNLYRLSKRYIAICEYYSTSPIAGKYRGNDNCLFKRDFAGELIDKYNLKLIDYGFIYHRDNYFPLDDITWFLLEK